MIERLRLSQTARPLDVLHHWSKERTLELSPPYQRGEVWGKIRQRNLIRSIVFGIPIPSIIINDRFSAGWENDESIAVIDGKQRITSILRLLDNRLQIPGEWFGMKGMVYYSELPLPQQRGLKQRPIQFCEGQLKTMEDEQELFELVNFGGVPQGESDEIELD